MTSRTMWHVVAPLVLVLLLATRCDSIPESAVEGSPSGGPSAAFPTSVARDQRLLFHEASERLVLYDVKRKQIVSEPPPDQTFQYAFPDRSPTYTSGDSTRYGFAIIGVRGGQVRTLIEGQGRQSIVPVAALDATQLFLVTDYGSDGLVERHRLSRLEAGKLVHYRQVDTYVAGGVILDELLFFTSPPTPAGDTYDLYSLKVADLGARPRLLRTSLTEPDVYAYRGEVVADDRSDRLDRTLPCDTSCYIDEAKDLLFSLRLNKDADFTLDVVDMSSGAVRASTSGDIVGYEIGTRSVTVYLVGDIVELPLPGVD